MTAVNGLAAGPATIEIGTGPSKITITPADQLNDASFNISRDQFELKSQQSSRPVAYIVTGLEPMIEISLSRVTIENIGLVFQVDPELITETINTALITKKRVTIKDDAGKVLTGQKVVIYPEPKPYKPSSVVPTTTTYNGKTYATVSAAEDAYDADVARWNNYVNEEVVTFPNGSLVSIDGTNLTYGLQTQRVLTMKITGLPDENGVRMYYGNEDAELGLLTGT